jgi:hypothetical protein
MDLVPKQKARLFETPREQLLNPKISLIKEPKFGDLDVIYDYVNKRWIVGVKK